jgi:hypothetical protein
MRKHTHYPHSRRRSWNSAALLAAFLVSPLAGAADPCGAFSWDLTLERALFGAAPEAMIAGHDTQTAPVLDADTLYELQLSPERNVSFAAAPGGKHHDPDGYAGLARLGVSPAGTFRLSTDQPVWLDVVLKGQVIASKDFQDHAGCSTPHKVVEFDLPASVALMLQISGAKGSTVRLTLTPAPAPPPAPVPAAASATR